MDTIIYEDSPYSDIRQIGAPIIAMLPFAIIVSFCLFTNNTIGLIGGFVAGLLIGFYHLLLFPRKYQIVDSKLRLVLGDVFPLDMPFDKLESVTKPARKEWWRGTSLGFGIFYADHTVQIVQKNRRVLRRININPRQREEFLKQLNRAMDNWNTRSRGKF